MAAGEPELGFGLFDDFPEDEIHPLQIDIFEDESDVLNQLACAKVNIYRPVEEGTELHRAIRSGIKSRIDALINAYQLDFDKIRDYLVLKYQWDPENRIWLRKINLVAVDEDQCRSVKELEKSCGTVEHVDLERSVFILLLTPINGEEVAVLLQKYCDPAELFRVTWKLFRNGFLTWNYFAEGYGSRETLIECAAACGQNMTIKRLHSLGAQLSPPEHNPLLAACSSLRRDTVRYLLENYFDQFDCTQRNKFMNAFIILMPKNDTKLMDYVLTKMIQYREKYFGENKSQAFNAIFRYEIDSYSFLSILTHVKPGPVSQKIEQYIIEYELDLSYQWQNVTILQQLLQKKLAMEYCRAGIRKNPELLGLRMPNESTILHVCIQNAELSLLRDIYESYPKVKKFFEIEYSFSYFREALNNRRNDEVEFILEYHKEFLLGNIESLQNVLLKWHNSVNFLEINKEVLIQQFPRLKEPIEAAIEKAHEVLISNDLVQEYTTITKSIKANPQNVSKYKHRLNSIRGQLGQSLLHFAVEDNNLSLFKQLLQAGCDSNALDNEGNHLIHGVQSVEMFKLIIESHPNGRSLVNITNSDGYTVLHKICSRYMDHTALIELLEVVIEYGANVNQLTKSGESVLFMLWSVKALQILLKYNINLEFVNDQGDMALLRQLCCQNTWIARELLPLFWELPSFADHAHKYLTPLVKVKRYIFESDYRSLLDANPEKIKLMFDSVYKRSPKDASELFSRACNRSRLYFVRKFLEYNYDLDYNCQDEYGYTPIMGLLNFSKENASDLIPQLLAKRVDLEIRNPWSKTPLLMLVESFSYVNWTGKGISMVQLLLDYGAQINTKDDRGNTALHIAFKNREWELVEKLIQNIFSTIDKDRLFMSLSQN